TPDTVGQEITPLTATVGLDGPAPAEGTLVEVFYPGGETMLSSHWVPAGEGSASWQVFLGPGGLKLGDNNIEARLGRDGWPLIAVLRIQGAQAPEQTPAGPTPADLTAVGQVSVGTLALVSFSVGEDGDGLVRFASSTPA